MEQDGFLFLSHCCDNSLHLNSVSEHEINILFIITYNLFRSCICLMMGLSFDDIGEGGPLFLPSTVLSNLYKQSFWEGFLLKCPICL